MSNTLKAPYIKGIYKGHYYVKDHYYDKNLLDKIGGIWLRLSPFWRFVTAPLILYGVILCIALLFFAIPYFLINDGWFEERLKWRYPKEVKGTK